MSRFASTQKYPNWPGRLVRQDDGRWKCAFLQLDRSDRPLIPLQGPRLYGCFMRQRSRYGAVRGLCSCWTQRRVETTSGRCTTTSSTRQMTSDPPPWAHVLLQLYSAPVRIPFSPSNPLLDSIPHQVLHIPSGEGGHASVSVSWCGCGCGGGRI